MNRDYPQLIHSLSSSDRIAQLTRQMLDEPRYLSIDQARIITSVYRETEGEPVHIRRAKALAASLRKMPIRIGVGELLVGNRTPGVRGGVAFPEAGLSWLDREIESLPTRPQDRFDVRPQDVEVFRAEILPFWKGKSLEDVIHREIGEEVAAISRVVKINQKDHAQGHICPDTEGWLRLGPAGLLEKFREQGRRNGDPQRFYESVAITLEGARDFMRRYAALAESMAGSSAKESELVEIARICRRSADEPPQSFYEALQSVWFLYVILHMESNASSFSPGRMDQYLYPYFMRDMAAGEVDLPRALELIEALWLKFNQIVYLRNSASARYFAGFPIGFNVAIGGQDPGGGDASNELSFLFLQAQEHIGLPQPNLSARLFLGSKQDFVLACSRVIGHGSGMPQIFNDEAVIPALKGVGISDHDARDYAIVGCVELTTHGNNLGWSDAAMFNMVKALELALTGGVCLVDNRRIGPDLGNLESYETMEELERAFAGQIDHFTERMIGLCGQVDRIHGEVLPSPFLSSVIRGCLEKGIDVTRGGAHYNLSGIQAIQPANIADSLAAIKKLVYTDGTVARGELLAALRSNFECVEDLRLRLLTKAPKYGNDIPWVDEMASHWVRYFAESLKRYANYREGPYHAGLYTVSAHVPMGHNVGASADGRLSGTPLADGGISAVYGRDTTGPTALLKSVARIDSRLTSNGTLLNMKFHPTLFRDMAGLESFAALLRTFVSLGIIHVQFNVRSEEDLLAAREHPELHRSLTVRVAGYTAYFAELAPDLQDEIIARTTHDLAV